MYSTRVELLLLNIWNSKRHQNWWSIISLENGNYSSLHELNSFPVLDGLWQNSPKEFILFAG